MENQAQIVAKMCKGDPEAFNLLFRQHQENVYRSAYALTGNEEMAKDILQDVFVAVWKYRTTFDPGKGGFSTWLHRITVNRCYKKMKTTGKNTPLSLEALEADGLQFEAGQRFDPEQDSITKEEYKKLLAALGNLSRELRVVVVLRFFNELSYEEIASAVDIPLGTVKSRLNAALKQINRFFCGEENS